MVAECMQEWKEWNEALKRDKVFTQQLLSMGKKPNHGYVKELLSRTNSPAHLENDKFVLKPILSNCILQLGSLGASPQTQMVGLIQVRGGVPQTSSSRRRLPNWFCASTALLTQGWPLAPHRKLCIPNVLSPVGPPSDTNPPNWIAKSFRLRCDWCESSPDTHTHTHNEELHLFSLEGTNGIQFLNSLFFIL